MRKSESQNVEYNRSWHDEYLRWVCGFANAKGGTIWIGIDDDRSVVGVAHAKKLMEDVPNLDWRNVASDRRNPTLADMFAQMDYMERKGSGLAMILDAYAKEVENPQGVEPKFFSGSGSFHVVLPNLNPGVAHGDAQDDVQGGTQGGTQAFVDDVIQRIVRNPKVTIKSLSVATGVPVRTLKRHLAKLPNVRYVGHGYSGHWEVVT